MRRLLDSRFVQTAMSGIARQISDEELDKEFEEFQQKILEILYSNQGYPVIDFILNDCYSMLPESKDAKKNKHLWLLIKRARANLRTCIAQNEKRLIYPELFSQPTPAPSRLYWAHNTIDLNELLTAMDLDSAIRYADGTKASMTDIVEEFSRFLNIRLGDAREVKRIVLRRKIKLTSYLDKLRNVIVTNC